jgi:Myb-like DNA-binding domain
MQQKGIWSEEEDEKLTHLVSTYGPRCWAAIATELQNRNGKQCRERWLNHLDPEISKQPWTPDEDATLARLHAQFKNSWAKIARHMPGRTDNSIKNHWNSTRGSFGLLNGLDENPGPSEPPPADASRPDKSVGISVNMGKCSKSAAAPSGIGVGKACSTREKKNTAINKTGFADPAMTANDESAVAKKTGSNSAGVRNTKHAIVGPPGTGDAASPLLAKGRRAVGKNKITKAVSTQDGRARAAQNTVAAAPKRENTIGSAPSPPDRQSTPNPSQSNQSGTTAVCATDDSTSAVSSVPSPAANTCPPATSGSQPSVHPSSKAAVQRHELLRQQHQTRQPQDHMQQPNPQRQQQLQQQNQQLQHQQEHLEQLQRFQRLQQQQSNLQQLFLPQKSSLPPEVLSSPATGLHQRGSLEAAAPVSTDLKLEMLFQNNSSDEGIKLEQDLRPFYISMADATSSILDGNCPAAGLAHKPSNDIHADHSTTDRVDPNPAVPGSATGSNSAMSLGPRSGAAARPRLGKRRNLGPNAAGPGAGVATNANGIAYGSRDAPGTSYGLELGGHAAESVMSAAATLLPQQTDNQGSRTIARQVETQFQYLKGSGGSGDLAVLVRDQQQLPPSEAHSLNMHVERTQSHTLSNQANRRDLIPTSHCNFAEQDFPLGPGESHLMSCEEPPSDQTLCQIQQRPYLLQRRARQPLQRRPPSQRHSLTQESKEPQSMVGAKQEQLGLHQRRDSSQLHLSCEDDRLLDHHDLSLRPAKARDLIEGDSQTPASFQGHHVLQKTISPIQTGRHAFNCQLETRGSQPRQFFPNGSPVDIHQSSRECQPGQSVFVPTEQFSQNPTEPQQRSTNPVQVKPPSQPLLREYNDPPSREQMPMTRQVQTEHSFPHFHQIQNCFQPEELGRAQEGQQSENSLQVPQLRGIRQSQNYYSQQLQPHEESRMCLNSTLSAPGGGQAELLSNPENFNQSFGHNQVCDIPQTTPDQTMNMPLEQRLSGLNYQIGFSRHYQPEQVRHELPQQQYGCTEARTDDLGTQPYPHAQYEDQVQINSGLQTSQNQDRRPANWHGQIEAESFSLAHQFQESRSCPEQVLPSAANYLDMNLLQPPPESFGLTNSFYDSCPMSSMQQLCAGEQGAQVQSSLHPPELGTSQGQISLQVSAASPRGVYLQTPVDVAIAQHPSSLPEDDADFTASVDADITKCMELGDELAGPAVQCTKDAVTNKFDEGSKPPTTKKQRVGKPGRPKRPPRQTSTARIQQSFQILQGQSLSSLVPDGALTAPHVPHSPHQNHKSSLATAPKPCDVLPPSIYNGQSTPVLEVPTVNDCPRSMLRGNLSVRATMEANSCQPNPCSSALVCQTNADSAYVAGQASNGYGNCGPVAVSAGPRPAGYVSSKSSVVSDRTPAPYNYGRVSAPVEGSPSGAHTNAVNATVGTDTMIGMNVGINSAPVGVGDTKYQGTGYAQEYSFHGIDYRGQSASHVKPSNGDLSFGPGSMFGQQGSVMVSGPTFGGVIDGMVGRTGYPHYPIDVGSGMDGNDVSSNAVNSDAVDAMDEFMRQCM